MRPVEYMKKQISGQDRLYAELRKKSFAGFVSADFSITQSNRVMARLAGELYGKGYLDAEKEFHSLYPEIPTLEKNERMQLIPITDGHGDVLGSITYVPPQRFNDGDKPRIAARIIADLDLTPENVDQASYARLKQLLEMEWPGHFWFADLVRKPVP